MAKNKGIPKTGTMAKGKLRPHLWLCGPDTYKHNMYTPWMRHRAQANFRGEEHDLSFDEFFELWDGQWEYRGRHADGLCMTRIDPELAWSKDNCELRIRKEHLAEQNRLKMGFGATRGR